MDLKIIIIALKISEKSNAVSNGVRRNALLHNTEYVSLHRSTCITPTWDFDKTSHLSLLTERLVKLELYIFHI